VKTYLASTADECVEDKAVTVVKDLLVSHPNTTALYSICGPSGIIITKVLGDRPAGSKKILSIAWDALPQEVKDIQAGKMDAAVAQFPVKLGNVSIEQAVRVSQGKSIPKITDTGTAIVTKANAKQFLKPR
jgi:ribose transport system substrate-binding protein